MRYLSKDGFTLLELILVLLIAGVAMTLTAVSFSRSYEKSILRQETSNVQLAMRHARERSLTERVPISFLVDEEAGQYWLEKGGETISKVRKLRDGLRIRGEPIVFLPKGNCTGGYITVTEKGDQDGIDEKGFEIEVDQVTGYSQSRRL